jgi:NAD(P)-dependent dehydrogenase (short-subunit alcohol dehydrogenase family)
MLETRQEGPLAVVLSQGDETVTQYVISTLEREGWQLEVLRGAGALDGLAADRRSVDGVVLVPGLLTGDPGHDLDPARDLLALVEAVSPRLRPAADGGARIVAVGSRDWLGWPTRPRLAAQAAALVATVRSLAIALGRRGVTVNAVIALPPQASQPRAEGPVPGSRLHEPVPLSGSPVTEQDIAETVSFFLDHRSGYITGQVLHCCGGASLLSSLSV